VVVVAAVTVGDPVVGSSVALTPYMHYMCLSTTCT
jgi:hypothetical protein